MDNKFDKLLLIPMSLFGILVLGGMFSLGDYCGIQKGKREMMQEVVKANLAEWVADEDGKPEFRFKQ